MKRLVFIISTLILSVAANAQQSTRDVIFGLTIGDVYTSEQIYQIVGTYGDFDKDLGEIEIDYHTYNAYAFTNVKYENLTVPNVVILTLPRHSFGGVIISYMQGNTPNGIPLDDFYGQVKQKLIDSNFEFEESGVENHPEIQRLQCHSENLSLRLDKFISEGAAIEVRITCLSYSAAILDRFARPVIQDTFFGMKMGSIQSVSSLKSAIGHKGNYLDEGYDSYGKNVSFTDVIFAGRTWDYCNFQLSDKGELYGISVYDSLNDGYGYEDDKKEAESIYNRYKEKLDAKYGKWDEKVTDDGKEVYYFGNNNMGILLSNERSKSQGGTYRRYVRIDYMQTAIYDRLIEAKNDEL